MSESFETLYRNEITNKGSRLVSSDPKEQCRIIYDCISYNCENSKDNILDGIAEIDNDIDDLCEEVTNIREKLNEQMDEAEVDEFLHDLDNIVSNLSDNLDGVYD